MRNKARRVQLAAAGLLVTSLFMMAVSVTPASAQTTVAVTCMDIPGVGALLTASTGTPFPGPSATLLVPGQTCTGLTSGTVTSINLPLGGVGCLLDLTVSLGGINIRITIGTCPAYPLNIPNPQKFASALPPSPIGGGGGGFPAWALLVGASALAVQLGIGSFWLRRRSVAN